MLLRIVSALLCHLFNTVKSRFWNPRLWNNPRFWNATFAGNQNFYFLNHLDFGSPRFWNKPQYWNTFAADQLVLLYKI